MRIYDSSNLCWQQTKAFEFITVSCKMRGGQIFLSVDILDKNFLLSISVKRTFLVYLARD